MSDSRAIRLFNNTASIEEVALRRKADAALAAMRAQNPNPVPLPTHYHAALGRSSTAPNGLLPPRGRPTSVAMSKPRSAMSPALSETIAFGRRVPLPPSPSQTSVFYQPPPGSAAGLLMPPPPQTAPSHGRSMARNVSAVDHLQISHHTSPRSVHDLHPPPSAMSRHSVGSRSMASLNHNATHNNTNGGSSSSHSHSQHHPPPTAEPVRHHHHHHPAAAAAAASVETEIETVREDIDDLAERIAQVERVTKMLTPEYTHSLQDKLQRSFLAVGERMRDIDDTLLTEAQKREVSAAVAIQAAARGMSQRLRYSLAKTALQCWRSRELQEVGTSLVAALRRMESIAEKIAEMHAHWRLRLKQNVLHEWLRVSIAGRPVRQQLDKELKARRHYRVTLIYRCFLGWQRVAHHASLVNVRWVTRNGRRVALRKDVASRMESHLLAWRRWTHVSRTATKRFSHLKERLAQRVFTAFKEQVSKRRRLRQLAVARWRDYSRAYWHLPFRAWYLFMVDNKLLRKVRAILIQSFVRKQMRRVLSQMLTAWHELAVHKAVETRSRSQLRVSLRAQEALTAVAEEALEEYAKVLQDAEKSLETEAKTQNTLTRQAEEARTELATLRVKCHEAQQEVLRLRTVSEYYAPPDTGGTGADQELRRVKALLQYIVSGVMPPSPSMEFVNFEQEAQLRMRLKEAAAQANVYAAPKPPKPPPKKGVREVHIPSHLGGNASDAAAAAAAAASGGGGGGGGGAAGRAEGPLRDLTFDDASITASELHSVPQIGPPGETAAEQVAKRVRERREELQARVARPRVHLYAAGEAEVETAEEAAAGAEEAVRDGAGLLAGALMGMQVPQAPAL